MIKNIVTCIVIVFTLVLVSFLISCQSTNTGFKIKKPCYIRTNQVGYTLNDTKEANLFTKNQLEDITFSVINDKTDQTILGPEPVGKTKGESYGFSYHYILDFSAITTAGTYRIELSDGKTRSTSFIIGENPYSGKADFILGFMRAQRCGDNPFLDAPCHNSSAGTKLMDAKAADGPFKGTVYDMSGGWHDAGDYIKFTIQESISTFFLLLAYRENPDSFGDEYSASGRKEANGQADVLDEARWGLDYLMKLHPEKESFYSQVANGLDHKTSGRLPEKDETGYDTTPYRPAYFEAAASVSGKAAAVLALGSTIFEASDPGYAGRCLHHARELYELASNNQKSWNGVPPDNFIIDKSFDDDMQLAAAELYAATGEKRYLEDAKRYLSRVKEANGWPIYSHVNFWAHYELYRNAPAALGEILKKKMTEDLDVNVEHYNNDVFGMSASVYEWGSMAVLAGIVLNASLYDRLFETDRYQQIITAGRDYTFGKNPWGVSFVVGMGHKYPQRPHHNYYFYNKTNIPGMPIEGPVEKARWEKYLYYDAISEIRGNDRYARYQSDRAVYYDHEMDYATNEMTIYQGAVTVAMVSFL